MQPHGVRIANAIPAAATQVHRSRRDDGRLRQRLALSLSPLSRCRMRSLLLLLLLLPLLPLPLPKPLIHENGCGDDAHDRDARGHQEI